MAAMDLSLNAAERFLELAAVPRGIPRDEVEFIESHDHVGDVDPEDPDVEHTIIGLSHLYPAARIMRPRDVAYLHYSAMTAYAACDMLETAAFDIERALRRPAPGSPEWEQAEAELPVSTRLQEALWCSCVNWMSSYDGALVEAIGAYWIAVHLDHARACRRLFRSEFVKACMWTGTAAWAREHLGLYENLPVLGYADLAEIVSKAAREGESAIRLMMDSLPPWDDHWVWVCQTAWHTGGPFPDVDQRVMDWRMDDYPAEIMNPEREAALNASLLHVFGPADRKGGSND